MKKALNNLIWWKWIILVSAIFAGSYAQSTGPERANIHFKKVQTQLNADYRQSYKDNVYLSSANTSSDHISNLLGMCGILFPVAKTQNQLSYFCNYGLNAGHEIFNIASHSICFSDMVAIRETAVFNLNASVTRGKSFLVPNDPVPVDMLSSQIQAGGGVKTKKRLSITYQYFILSESNYNGGKHRTYKADQAVLFTCSPKTSLLLRYETQREKELAEDPSEKDDTHTHAVRLGVNFAKILNHLAGHAELGGRYARGELYDVPETDSRKNGLNLNAEGIPFFLDADCMIEAMFSKVSLGLRGQLGIRPTFGTNRIYAFAEETPDITGNLVYLSNPFVSIAGFNLMSKWQVFPRLSTGADFTWESRTFPVGDRNDRLSRIDITAGWTFLRFWQFSLTCGRSRNRSNITAYDYGLNEASASLSVRL